MKNLKKISREQLKQVQGGSSVPQCQIGYIYKCDSFGICDETTGQDDCVCGCVPKVVLP
ncbi:bacteriocin-like protein [Chryseobacterium sp. FH2]|uniref:bacteriocin-like protein n=1 Tax=Chryseobacterium sp. FH2 TaxID=1674291 RepID=UPI000A8E4BA0